MYSFRTRYAIALAIILWQKFASACVEDLTCKRTISPKVFTNFLKVPWINLNISWTDQMVSHCRNDVTVLFESADAGEMWALKMLDAASRIPSGILKGNILDLGQYEECIGVTSRDNPANIQGQHCLVSFSIPSKFIRNAAEMLNVQKMSNYNPTADVNLSLTLSVCLPSSCSTQDVVGFVDASIQSIPEFVEFEVGVERVVCSGIESADDPTVGTTMAISFIRLIACVLLVCTVCDFIVRASYDNSSMALKTLAKFSIYTNTINLFNTEITSGTMPAIHGVRFLNTCLVVALHRLLFTFFRPLVNLSDIFEVKESMLGSFVVLLSYTVDTFFVISGFLTAYLFLKRMKSGKKFNILEFYLHRYIRLAPCIGILLLVSIFIFPHLITGPLRDIGFEAQVAHCRKNWWANLLFIQNFASREEMCLSHTWSAAVEMQFCLFCPIILYPLFYRPKLGLKMLSTLSIISMIIPAVQIIINNYSFLFNSTNTNAESFTDYFNSYMITYNRALPYLVGIFLGYDVVNNKRRFTKMQAAFNWILVCVFVLFCFWNARFVQPNSTMYHAISEVIHVSIGRLAWSLTIAWILYACTQGYGGPITQFLSLPVFIPFSRLSYCIYLVHVCIQVGVIFMQRTTEFFTPISTIYLIPGDILVSILIAFVLYVCIETPATILEEVVKAKPPTAIINRTRSRKEEKFSATISEYLNLIESEDGSDLVIEKRVQEIDFWRQISDVLNTLSKNTTKTPAEWAKIWRKWRNDTQAETCAKDIKNRPAQFQKRVTTLKKEFLIFLIALMVSMLAGDENCIERLAGSHLKFYIFQTTLPNRDFEEDIFSSFIRLSFRNQKDFVKFNLNQYLGK